MDVTLRRQFFNVARFLSGPRGTEIGRVNERPVSMAKRGLANVAFVGANSRWVPPSRRSVLRSSVVAPPRRPLAPSLARPDFDMPRHA